MGAEQGGGVKDDVDRALEGCWHHCLEQRTLEERKFRREMTDLRYPSGEVELAVRYMELRSMSPGPQVSRPGLLPDPRSLFPAATEHFPPEDPQSAHTQHV